MVTLTDCRVPAEASIDLGFMVTDRTVQDVDGNATASVLYASAIALGLAHGWWDRTVEYLTHRTAHRQPIASMQAIQHKLVRLRSQIEASRSLLYDAGRLRDTGRPDSELAPGRHRRADYRVHHWHASLDGRTPARFSWSGDRRFLTLRRLRRHLKRPPSRTAEGWRWRGTSQP
ncbi:MAG TPA: acyl-CoA dehydrogenase family protein [Pseudonocardia sp.]|uniref:acyl-CoA dehydrogenase family protein n=1 Tax=Pseudonocardia sp. TaxID=60912 RepID=UPI002C48101E|nr:acyl-CoA dehydrogenase family protein [Pseudonocardia sp.]HTF54718.1 acyl-CoA dehydrogenase family protein [Pseudonocardia sp.]